MEGDDFSSPTGGGGVLEGYGLDYGFPKSLFVFAGQVFVGFAEVCIIGDFS